jgi:hypothetical protein
MEMLVELPLTLDREHLEVVVLAHLVVMVVPQDPMELVAMVKHSPISQDQLSHLLFLILDHLLVQLGQEHLLVVVVEEDHPSGRVVLVVAAMVLLVVIQALWAMLESMELVEEVVLAEWEPLVVLVDLVSLLSNTQHNKDHSINYLQPLQETFDNTIR